MAVGDVVWQEAVDGHVVQVREAPGYRNGWWRITRVRPAPPWPAAPPVDVHVTMPGPHRPAHEFCDRWRWMAVESIAGAA